jgi:hypothetical protein
MSNRKPQTTCNNKNGKKKSLSRHRSSLEIKKYLVSKRKNNSKELTIDHLQSFYRFCDEKSRILYNLSLLHNDIKEEDEEYSDDEFTDESFHFALLNVMNDIVMLFHIPDISEENESLLLESLKFAFPKESVNFTDMKNDIQMYGKHLYHSIISYFQ